MSRPDSVFDQGLQHERTALAWERTAIASMVAGVLMARYAADARFFAFAFIGIAQVVIGAGLLLWSARHYDDLHGPLRDGQTPIHPTATRTIGLAVVGFAGACLVLSVLIAVSR